MIPRKCRRAREAWSEAFDRHEGPHSTSVGHAADCPACRAFTAATAAARTGLQAFPEPAANPAADLAVLQALRPLAATGCRPSTPAVNGITPGRLLRSALGRTVAAGFASFAVTLIVAQVLSNTAVSDPKMGAWGDSRPLAIPSTGYLVNRIELWTGAAPDASLAPSPRTPAVPRPDAGGKPPADAGETGDRADESLSVTPLG